MQSAPFDEWLRWLRAAGKGPESLYASRGRPFTFDITIPGDYTGAALAGEVRLEPDAAGDPLATFVVAGPVVANGVSTFTLFLGGEATAALPAAPSGEYVAILAYDLVLKPAGGYVQLYRGGCFNLLGRVTAAVPGATGVLFDTACTDSFDDLIYTPDASLTVTDGSVAFSSASPTEQILTIPAANGTDPLLFCFDHWTIEATFVVTSFPGAGLDGAFAAARYNDMVADQLFGMRIGSAGSATTILVSAVTANTVIENTLSEAGVPKTITVSYRHNLTDYRVEHEAHVSGGTDSELDQPYSGGSFIPPTRFYKGVLDFKQGVLTCTGLKLSADYPNARFAFLGDSLTVGAAADPITGGYAHLIRADYPDQVLIAAASGSTTSDWEDIVESVVRMAPVNAFVCLGTNDRLGAVSVADSQAAMLNVMGALGDAGIKPIALASPPIGNSDVPTFNTWLAAQDWDFVDIYTPLASGTSLKGDYDSGDGIHWNEDGHQVVHDAVAAYIAAEGL